VGATLTHAFGRLSGFWLAATAALVCIGTDAGAVTYADILGNWCSATARLEFSRNTMGVLLFADKTRSTARITRYEFAGSTVTVYWIKDGKETSSDFGEFSADGRTMFLQPADNVPRREYRRC